MHKRTPLYLLIVMSLLLTTCLVSAQDAAATTDAAPTCETGFRLFTHELLWSEIAEGVCIPEKPQQIAFAWPFHIPALLRTGYPLAAVANHEYLISQFPEWEAQITAVADVGLPPNLESVLTVNPDVIIEPDWAAGDNYAELSEIAPTIAFQFDGTHQWKQLAEMYFQIAGMQDAYDELIAEYEARATELGALIGNPQEIEVSLVWFSDKPNAETNYSSGGILLSDIGFARPASQIIEQTPEEVIAAGGYPFFTEFSWEEVTKADGDLIIVAGDWTGEAGAAALAELEANPLWQSLSAVQAGNVHYTSMNWGGGDIAGAHNLLDDIAEAFGVADEFSPNPYATINYLPGVEGAPEATPEATPAS
jgi:iron complex transport system substrate-binding protein